MFNLLTVNNNFLTGECFQFPSFSSLFIPHFFNKIKNEERSKKNLTDDQCLKKIASGQEEPFVEIFNRYGDLVFGYCVKLLKDRSQAEDASQEVWVKVIKNAGRYQGRGQFKAWLMQIARNTCFSTFRDLKKNKSEDISNHEIEDISQKDILNLMTEDEDRIKLKACIEKLPENQRVALLIWMTEDPSYEELADLLKVSVSAVKSLLFRSRQALKEMMS